MQILDFCETTPATSAEIARSLGLSVSTAHRLVTSLLAHGLLGRTGDGQYVLGGRLMAGGVSAVAQEILQRLTKVTGETAQLWVAGSGSRVCTAISVTDHELRVEVSAGARILMADGGSGAEALQGRVNPEGWVESIEHRVRGLASVSAPVYVHKVIVAAVCIVVPAARVSGSPGKMFGRHASSAAALIAKRLEPFGR